MDDLLASALFQVRLAAAIFDEAHQARMHAIGFIGPARSESAAGFYRRADEIEAAWKAAA